MSKAKIKQLEAELEEAKKSAVVWEKVANRLGGDLLKIQAAFGLSQFDTLRLNFLKNHSKVGATYSIMENWTHVVTEDGEDIRDVIDAAKEAYDRAHPPLQTQNLSPQIDSLKNSE